MKVILMQLEEIFEMQGLVEEIEMFQRSLRSSLVPGLVATL